MTEEQAEKLALPFTFNEIEWRILRISKKKPIAQVAAYVNSRAIQRRLDYVIGRENWQNEFETVTGPANSNTAHICKLSIYYPERGEWITKSDGAGCTDVEPIKERITALKVGDVCPTCKMQVTESNFEETRNHLIAECNRIGELGRSVVERGKEIAELDKKAQAQFEQWKADDIAKYSAELRELQNGTEQINVAEIRAKLNTLAELEKYGNLSEEEYSELSTLEATLIGINAQIEAVEQSASKEKLKRALVEKDVFAEQITKYKNIVSALTEYIFKRAELATAELNMPNVKIRLFEIIRGTGEVKPAFKFDYKGREYTALSLSEKTLAGIEISALIRRITGKDYPICIDNTESIAAFNDVDMPSQVMLIRVVKGQPLTVKFQNNYTASVPVGNEVGKAA